MSMRRGDVRDLVKTKLSTLSTQLTEVFSNEAIHNSILETLRSLPYRGVLKEEKWKTTIQSNVKEYPSQSGTLKIDRVQINMGSASVPDWQPCTGWELFANVLHLKHTYETGRTLRVWAYMKWTEITDDNTDFDTQLDDKTELLVIGTVRRLMENLVNYLIDSGNYDSTIKPTGATLPQVRQWREEMRTEEERLTQSFHKAKKPGMMNMVD